MLQKGEPEINKSIRINGAIRARELRIIGPDGEQLGIMSLKEALNKANDINLDLVEISPGANPPVAKIIDWGKYQYQKMKDQQKNRRQAKSLEGGHKVRIQVVYKGREMAHKEIGYELIDKIMEHLSEDAILEQKPQMAGRNLSVVIRSK